MSTRLKLFAGAAPCFALALMFLLRPGSPSTAPPSAADVAPPRESHVVNSDTAVLIHPTPQQETRAVRDVATSAVTSAAPEPAQMPLPGERAAPMAQFFIGSSQDLPPDLIANERRFATESIDPSWAPATEAEIFGKIAQQTGLKLLDLRVECRTTMCLVQTTQPEPAADARPGEFFSTLGLQPRWIMTKGEPGTPLRSVAYLWREGTMPVAERTQAGSVLQPSDEPPVSAAAPR